MKREEAIEVLKREKLSLDEKYYEAINMAIEALQAETDGDLISRQDALKPFYIAPDGTRIPEVDCDNFPVEFSVEFIKKHLLSLPSAEPKTVGWIPCSEGLPKEHEWIGTKAFGTTISDEVLVTFDVDGTRFVKPLSLQNGKLSRPDAQTMDAFHKGWKMLAWMSKPEPYKGGEEK